MMDPRSSSTSFVRAWEALSVPLLRLHAAPLHANEWRGADGVLRRIVVWTYEEWDQLPEWQRPERAQRLPGIGWSLLEPVEE